MGKSLEQFEKWIRGQDQIPAYPRYGTIDEDSAAKDAWRAALEWVNSFPGYDMTDIIDEELDGE